VTDTLEVSVYEAGYVRIISNSRTRIGHQSRVLTSIEKVTVARIGPSVLDLDEEVLVIRAWKLPIHLDGVVNVDQSLKR